MTHHHGAVAVLLLHHELCHGLAHDVGASQDDTLLATGRDVVATEQFQDTLGRGTHETGQSQCHAPHVDGGETIHVLLPGNGLVDALLVDVTGQGELHDETVHLLVSVQFLHLAEEFCLGDILLIAYQGTA